MEIYVLIDDKPQGPYTPELIRQYLASGQLKPTDLAAYAGRADWKPLSVLQSRNQGAARRRVRIAGSSKGKKSRALLAVAAVAVVVSAGVGGYFWWKLQGKKAQPTTSDAAAVDAKTNSPTSSLPRSFAELNAWYAEPPEGQNAATFFIKGFEAFQITSADQNSRDLPTLGLSPLPLAGTPFSARAKTTASAFLERNKAAWDAWEEGSHFEQSRYPIDLNLGPDTMLVHLSKVKQAALFCQLRAAISAEGKDSTAATDSLLVSLALSQSLKDEPTYISQLVRVAGLAIETASLNRVVNSMALSSGDLERLSTALARAESEEESGEWFTRALVMEKVSTLWFLDLAPDQLVAQFKKSGIEDDPAFKNLAATEILKNVGEQRAFVEETFNHAFEIRRDSFPDRLKVDDYFSSRVDEAKGKEYYICQMMLPALGKAARREASGMANLRLAETAVALERYRQANAGKYPDSLKALTPAFLPAVPMDPFTGEQLYFARMGDGYEARCSGPDPKKPISVKVARPPQ